MNKLIIIGAVILGVVFFMLGIYYWITPSGNLFHFLPGYQAGSTHIYFKHGLAAVILAILSFTFVWFNSAKKKSAN